MDKWNSRKKWNNWDGGDNSRSMWRGWRCRKGALRGG